MNVTVIEPCTSRIKAVGIRALAMHCNSTVSVQIRTGCRLTVTKNQITGRQGCFVKSSTFLRVIPQILGLRMGDICLAPFKQYSLLRFADNFFAWTKKRCVN